MDSDVAVLVISCDKYSDLWNPFFTIFDKYWPDCPYPIYLGSNHTVFNHPRVLPHPIGDDLSWADSVYQMIERLHYHHFIIFLEDFFLERRVNSSKVHELVEIAMRHNIGCLHFTPKPYSDNSLPFYPGIGVIRPGTDYRVSTSVAIWKKDTLKRLLLPGFSAWDFELKGSPMSDNMPDEFWGINKPVIYFRHAVERGKWLPRGLTTCKKEGINVNLNARPAMSTKEYLWWHLYTLRGRLFRILPSTVRRKLRTMLSNSASAETRTRRSGLPIS